MECQGTITDLILNLLRGLPNGSEFRTGARASLDMQTQSERGTHFRALKAISGFRGSAGTRIFHHHTSFRPTASIRISWLLAMRAINRHLHA